MLFVTREDIDGVCGLGQILSEAQMAEILWDADFVDCVACVNERAAEFWVEEILKGVKKCSKS